MVSYKPMCVNTFLQAALICKTVLFSPIEATVNFQKIYIQRISYYQATKNQTDSTPNLSACGKTKSAWRQIAVSRDLFRKLGCGKKVLLVIGNKYYAFIVWDTMNKRYKNSVDILVGKEEPAFKYEVKRGILLY